jgi:signal transduction histidine kinase
MPAQSSPELPTATPPDAPELSTRTISMVLLRFVELHGRERLEKIWREHQFELPLEYVETLTNFISLRFEERFVEVLNRESGDPNFMRVAGMKTSTPKAIGFAYYMLKAFGSPRMAYAKVVELNPTYNRVGIFSIEQLGSSSLTLRYESKQREANRNLCEARMGQFAGFPTIWGMPPAEIIETECHVHGAAACRYELKWQNPPKAWRTWAGLVTGAFAGATISHFGLHLSPIAIPLMATTFGLAGAAWDAVTESARKDAFLLSQNEGLMQSLHELEQRHEDVVRAQQRAEALNRELEGRVAARTQELSDTNDQLARALERQKELDRLKTEFFDNVSHELRTPLTLILLSLEALLGDPGPPPRVREHLETMERSSSRLLRMINELLDLAKIESGKLRLRYQPIALGPFLRSLLLPFRVLADEKQIALEVSGELATPVYADPERLDVIFQNLLSNALKFTARGGVELSLSENETHALICVRDSGEGISEADLPVIFDRFAQADARGVRRFGGTGIGLALVKELVEIHGGTISVESRLGEGTTFRVALPKGAAHLQDELRDRRVLEVPVRRERRSPGPMPALHRAKEAVPPFAPLGAPVDARKILIVEDDAELRQVLRGMLGSRYRTVECDNGEEALELARRERPDLILSDVMMPRASGLQLTAALRALPELADTPIVLLTARRGVDETLEGLSAGANDYVGKPFNPRELIARIETQLKLREATAQLAANERLSSVGLMSSGFAHEVRNPLNGLLNALGPLRELVDESNAGPAASELVSLIDQCGERLRGLAEELLSFSAHAPAEELVDVPAALDATLKVVAWKLKPGVEVKRRYRASSRVRGNAGELNQVWLNLIDNAIRAMGESGTLTLEVDQAGSDLQVAVRDTGGGIPPENLGRLFQPFFTTRRAGEGTGLGLALSRKIVARHQGKISVESRPGEGARFCVRLPAAV